MLIEVLAAGLHPRTRSSANGSHYTSTGTYTIDAVATPLAQVESAWNAPLAPGQRIVFVPTGT
jgi:hypothetical protein